MILHNRFCDLKCSKNSRENKNYVSRNISSYTCLYFTQIILRGDFLKLINIKRRLQAASWRSHWLRCTEKLSTYPLYCLTCWQNPWSGCRPVIAICGRSWVRGCFWLSRKRRIRLEKGVVWLLPLERERRGRFQRRRFSSRGTSRCSRSLVMSLEACRVRWLCRSSQVQFFSRTSWTGSKIKFWNFFHS